MNEKDTIAAIATPPGRGGVGILRVSGPFATNVAIVLLGKIPKPRQAEYLPFISGNEILDYGIAIFFPKPHSLTGEDVLELQGHGGPLILDLLLKHIITVPSVRIAHPGEFLERAFINDKLDLAQAEAIADLIEANSVQAVRSAVNSLQGVFSSLISDIVEKLTKLRLKIEAAIDFPDEEIDSLFNNEIEIQLDEIISNIEQVRNKANYSNILREGVKIVIAGKPNAGKSSLLNALAEREIAIVTPIEGTTRDVLREDIYIDGIPLRIIDTAGLRNVNNLNDEVEKIGIDRAWSEISHADHILYMIDSSLTTINEHKMLLSDFITHLHSNIPITVIRNKADLTGETIGIKKIDNLSIITISVQSSANIDLLRDYLKQTINFATVSNESNFLARRRHIEALDTAAIHLQQGKKQLLITTFSIELLAEDLRLAQQALNTITGKFSSDELLSRIFSTFCIGK